MYPIGTKLRIIEDEMGAREGTIVEVTGYRQFGRHIHYTYKWGDHNREWIASEIAVEPVDDADKKVT